MCVRVMALVLCQRRAQLYCPLGRCIHNRLSGLYTAIGLAAKSKVEKKFAHINKNYSSTLYTILDLLKIF